MTMKNLWLTCLFLMGKYVVFKANNILPAGKGKMMTAVSVTGK